MKKLILRVFIATSLLLSCGSTNKDSGEWKQMDDGVYYRLFYFQGMPCIQFSPKSINSFQSGFTCDWSTWEGSVDEIR